MELRRELLSEKLAKKGLILDQNGLEHLWDWLKFWYREDREQELISMIIDFGKCLCGKSEWAIHQDQEAGDSKAHWNCQGCREICDQGENKENGHYSFISESCGAYVFWKDGKRVEEWYCSKCKFELLCGDCGSPHGLETEFYTKGEYEDFYTCDNCEVDRYDRHHEEKHQVEPSLECSRCEDFLDNWNQKIEQLNKSL